MTRRVRHRSYFEIDIADILLHNELICCVYADINSSSHVSLLSCKCGLRSIDGFF